MRAPTLQRIANTFAQLHRQLDPTRQPGAVDMNAAHALAEVSGSLAEVRLWRPAIVHRMPLGTGFEVLDPPGGAPPILRFTRV